MSTPHIESTEATTKTYVWNCHLVASCWVVLVRPPSFLTAAYLHPFIRVWNSPVATARYMPSFFMTLTGNASYVVDLSLLTKGLKSNKLDEELPDR